LYHHPSSLLSYQGAALQGYSLTSLADDLAGRPLRVATMPPCAPLLYHHPTSLLSYQGAALQGYSLASLADDLAGRPLRVATMCSGTESPLLALDMICKSLRQQTGKAINVEHVFSCEIEPFKQVQLNLFGTTSNLSIRNLRHKTKTHPSS